MARRYAWLWRSSTFFESRGLTPIRQASLGDCTSSSGDLAIGQTPQVRRLESGSRCIASASRTPRCQPPNWHLFGSVPYIDESHLDKFQALIKGKFADFKDTGQITEEEEWEADFERLIVSKEGYDRMMSELGRMVNVEMVNLTKELSKVADVSGDVRENVEYNALMEKQTILKMTINKLEDEIKRAEILELEDVSTDLVDIGTNVIFEDIDNGEKGNYIILGPWDADFGKRILSYRSPIAKALLGKRVDDEIDVRIGDDRRRFKVIAIEKYSA